MHSWALESRSRSTRQTHKHSSFTPFFPHLHHLTGTQPAASGKCPRGMRSPLPGSRSPEPVYPHAACAVRARTRGRLRPRSGPAPASSGRHRALGTQGFGCEGGQTGVRPLSLCSSRYTGAAVGRIPRSSCRICKVHANPSLNVRTLIQTSPANASNLRAFNESTVCAVNAPASLSC